MPPGGDGYYYFFVYLVVRADEYGYFDIELNEEIICTAFADQQNTAVNDGPTSCSAIAYVAEGNMLNLPVLSDCDM